MLLALLRLADDEFAGDDGADLGGVYREPEPEDEYREPEADAEGFNPGLADDFGEGKSNPIPT